MPIARANIPASLPAGAQEERIRRALQEAAPEGRPRQLLLREGFNCTNLRCERRFAHTFESQQMCVVTIASERQALDVRVSLDESGAVRSVAAMWTPPRVNRHAPH